MTQTVIIRPWPAQMPAELAAEYCGYTGPNRASAFRAAVKRGLYPRPVKRPGEKQKWRKSDLDARIGGPAAQAGLPDVEFE